MRAFSDFQHGLVAQMSDLIITSRILPFSQDCSLLSRLWTSSESLSQYSYTDIRVSPGL